MHNDEPTPPEVPELPPAAPGAAPIWPVPRAGDQRSRPQVPVAIGCLGAALGGCVVLLFLRRRAPRPRWLLPVEPVACPLRARGVPAEPNAHPDHDSARSLAAGRPDQCAIGLWRGRGRGQGRGPADPGRRVGQSRPPAREVAGEPVCADGSGGGRGVPLRGRARQRGQHDDSAPAPGPGCWPAAGRHALRSRDSRGRPVPESDLHDSGVHVRTRRHQAGPAAGLMPRGEVV